MTARTKYWVHDAAGTEVYEGILNICAECCSTYSLVINKRALPSKGAFEFLEEAKPFVVSDQQQTSWPGGGILEPGKAAQVVYVRVCPESIALLKRAARGLYEWVHPHLPEDLAFYRSDNSTFFAVVGHECAAFFEVDSAEEEQVRVRLPDLELLTSSPI